MARTCVGQQKTMGTLELFQQVSGKKIWDLTVEVIRVKIIIWFLLKQCHIPQSYWICSQSSRVIRVAVLGSGSRLAIPSLKLYVLCISAHRCPPPAEASGILPFRCTRCLPEQHCCAEEFFKVQHPLSATNIFRKSLLTAALSPQP